MKPNSSFLLAFALLYAVPMTGGGLRKTIHLKPGTNSINISDAVLRGDRNWYYLRASAGQTLSIAFTSLEHNAGYSIYEPGYRIQKHVDYEEVEGNTIIEADEKHLLGREFFENLVDI